jgi:hypothetical protein
MKSNSGIKDHHFKSVMQNHCCNNVNQGHSCNNVNQDNSCDKVIKYVEDSKVEMSRPINFPPIMLKCNEHNNEN